MNSEVYKQFWKDAKLQQLKWLLFATCQLGPQIAGVGLWGEDGWLGKPMRNDRSSSVET